MDQDLRILLLTGRMAFNELEKVVEEQTNISVEALPISVAAFTTPDLLRRNIPELISKHTPDIVFVSGMAQGDFSSIHDELGIHVLKGPKKLSSLPLLLEHLDDIKDDLSSTKAADRIIQNYILDDLRFRFKTIEQDAVFGVRNFKTSSGLSIGLDLPPRIMAEIVDVSTRPIEVSIASAKRYSQWADILDIGASIGAKDPERIAEVVQEVRKLGVPVSIDSLDSTEIIAAIDVGAEIVLSIDYGNKGVISKIPEDVILVCLPTNVSEGIYPQNPTERAKKCFQLCNELRENKHSQLLVDPVMESAIQPGLLKSLIAFHEFRNLDQDTPFLAGFANVTEFLDSDSLGVNAVLSCLGVELGISVFLTTEERASTIHCVRELHSTAQFAFIAKMSNTSPKELGLTAFAAKSRTHNIQSVDLDASYEEVMHKVRNYVSDSKGCFRIGIDHLRERILCEHRDGEGKIQRLASENVHSLLGEILERDLVGSIGHASYLGAELTKAEIALRLGHDYQQDEQWTIELSSDFSSH